MKKVIALMLAAAMCVCLVACGEKTATAEAENPEVSVVTESESPEITDAVEAEVPETVVLTKDEMLSSAQALTREEIDKSLGNVAFAKSLIGNTYTFGGDVFSVAEDHAVVTFYITDEQGAYGTGANMMVANLYLPLEELISLETEQRLSFVGVLEDVSTHDESIPDWGTQSVIDMVFKNVAVVSDRFEETGKLHSKNASYGEDAWNIKFPNNDYLSVVHFRDDVSAYQGKEITYSYKVTGDGCIDAYIVE